MERSHSQAWPGGAQPQSGLAGEDPVQVRPGQEYLVSVRPGQEYLVSVRPVQEY